MCRTRSVNAGVLAALFAVAVFTIDVVAVHVALLALAAALLILLALATALLVLLFAIALVRLIFLTALVLLIGHTASPSAGAFAARADCPNHMKATQAKTLEFRKIRMEPAALPIVPQADQSLSWSDRMDSGDGSPVAWFTSIFITVVLVIGVTLIVSANVFT
jgi:hypothetical protein